ncbi:MAG: HAMP domain-containing histidine kinase [bacterium]|nr:HAMP domain-containing histidine kinase [bacterium]
MLGENRTVRFAIIGFTVVTVLVLSGLSWATVASLRLEETTRRIHASRDLGNRLEIARLRMDNYLWPILIREASRSFEEYAPSPRRDHPRDAETYAAQPIHSPESWIALHFQVTEDLCWTSPQLKPLPTSTAEITALRSSSRGDDLAEKIPHITCVEADDSDPVAVERKDLLEELAAAYTPDDFSARMAAVRSASSNGSADARIVSLGDAALQRQAQAARLQQEFLPAPLECERPARVRQITRGVKANAHETEEGFVSVRPREIAAITLPPPPGGDRSRVALVRRIDIGGDRVFQGLIVDLGELTDVLSTHVRDLFARVDLRVAVDESISDEAPATRLGSLPIRLVVPESELAQILPTPSSGHATMVIAWVTALVALAAVGLGVKRLVSLSERRREFTYAVTHELRTPLTTFQLYTDMLAAGLVPEEKKAFYLETIHTEARRLSDLITEVLEFARIESNTVHTQMRTYTIGELMETLRQRHESRCRSAGLVLEVTDDETDQRQVYTDPHIALQILGTVIDNACKYASGSTSAAGIERTPPDNSPAGIHIRVNDLGPRLAIEVTDDGPGIPPEERASLFKPFQRGGRGRSVASGGVGLGLALAKRWTRLIGGSLELVDHAQTSGACFRLTLPTPAA